MTNLRFIRTLLAIAVLFPMLLSTQGRASSLQHAPGQILIRFREGAAKPAMALADSLAARFDIRGIEPVFPTLTALRKPSAPFGQVYRLTYNGSSDPSDVAAAFANRADVVYASPNHLFRPLAVPNDPRLSDQPNLPLIGWQELWDGLGPLAQEVTVAIIDSGVDLEHVDLRDRIWINQAESTGLTGVDDDGNGYVDDVRGWDFSDAPTLPGKGDYLFPDNDPSDESGHGTRVAGVVGAQTDNAEGIAGVAPDCRLMALRAGVTMQSGETFLEEDDLAAAILYAVDHGARVINMSWGSEELAYVIRDVLAYAYARGAVLVVAAGNSGQMGLSHPAALDITIAVGATDNANNRSSFSSRGVPLDLAAPGSSVLSTTVGDAYGRLSGTSFAAPHVSGLAALVLSRSPHLSPEGVRSLLVASATDLGSPAWDVDFGAGLANGPSLLAALEADRGTAEVRIQAPTTGSGFIDTVAIHATASGGGLVSYELSWGEGPAPELWHTIVHDPGAAAIDATWRPEGLADTVAVIRLAGILDDGTLVEDRVLVSVGPRPLTIVSPDLSPVLDGDRLVYQVRWSTAFPTRGAVAFGPVGAAPDTVASPFVHTEHTVTLPSSLPPGLARYEILATGPTGERAASSLNQFQVSPLHVPTSGFSEVARLPDGILADRAVDFDADGLSEVVLMPYVDGLTFSPVQAFERAVDGSFESVFTSSGSYLPWSLGDVDGDGEPDLVASEVARLHVFRATADTPYPGQALYSLNNTWGGEVVDLDGDGTNEIVARAGSQNGYDVITYDSGQGARSIFLSNPTPGPGRVGQRPVVRDLDGDGIVEVLGGDADGDLWVHKGLGDGSFADTWTLLGDDDTDARWLGGGADLDGDGVAEFAVARSLADDNDALNGYWELEIYGAAGPGAYELEWRTRVTGVLSSGNGITTADADGDGQDDLIVCLRPDLYVFRSDGPDRYRPIWHSEVSLTHRPLVADLDGDGLPEILYNLDDAVRVVERTTPPATVAGPEFLSSTALGPDRVALSWLTVSGVDSYRILRGSAGSSLTQIADGLTTSTYVDSGLTSDQAYRYQVIAVLSDESVWPSGITTVRPNATPKLIELRPLGGPGVALLFSEPIGPLVPDAFQLTPGQGRATSVIRDREYHRVILTFPKGLAEDTAYVLSLATVADTSGTPIDGRFTTVTFSTDRPEYPFAEIADFDADRDVDFSDFLLFARAYGGTDPRYDLDGDTHVAFSDFILFASLYGRTF